MSRTFAMPRYEVQTGYKLLAHIDCADARRPHFASESLRNCTHLRDPTIIGVAGVDLEIYDTDEAGGFVNYLDKGFRYAYDEGSRKQDKFAWVYRIGTIASEILSKVSTVYTDDDAMARLTSLYLSGTIKAKVPGKTMSRWATSTRIADDVCLLAMAAGKNSAGVAPFGKLIRSDKSCTFGYDMAAWAECMEKLVTSGTPSGVKAAFSSLTDGEVPSHKFKIEHTYFAKHSGVDAVYRLPGITLILVGGEGYALDYSAIDQIWRVARYWAGSVEYAANYRLTGSLGTEQGDMLAETIVSARFVGKFMSDPGEDKMLARHMKSCLALLEEEVHQSAEPFETGSKERIKVLEEECKKYSAKGEDWYSVVKKMNLSDRAKLDIAYAFHGICCPDIDARALFSAVNEKLKCSNKVDEAEWSKFMSYTRSFDLAYAISAFGERALIKVKTVQGYKLEGQKWVERCMKGSPYLPPDEDMGKAWLEDFYEFDPIADRWFFESQDVTHVIAERDLYLSTNGIPDRWMHNELAWALKKAPYLSRATLAGDARIAMCKKKTMWDTICILAGKAENTKYGSKARETYSMCDISRELTSEYDRTAIPVAKHGTVVALRLAPEKLNLQNQKIANNQMKGRRTAVVSLDVSGWSPNMSRAHAFDHHDYIAKQSQVPEGYTVAHMWDEGSLIINKRGDIMVSEGRHGMYQGLTGTMDTVLHRHIVTYVVRYMKRGKVLRKDEFMTGEVYIDDGVIAIEMSGERTNKECQHVIDVFYETVINVYAKLGFKVDKVKALFSCIKFTFLNRLYLGGSEVPRPLKVFAKADRELTRNYPSIVAQIGSIFGSYSASLIKGADPFVAYYFAIRRSIDLILQTNGAGINYGTEAWFVALFAPESLNGFNFPLFHEFCGPACVDRLSSFIGTMQMAAKCIEYQPVSRSIRARAQAMISRDFVPPTAKSLCNGARTINFVGVHSASTLARRVLESSLAKFDLSAMFKETIAAFSSSTYWKTLDEVCKACAWDMTMLEVTLDSLPVAIVSSLLMRCFNNELHSMIISMKDRKSLAKRVRSQNDRFVRNAFTLSIDDEKLLPSRDDLSHLHLASEIRTNYYLSGGFTIYNHTVPDPIHMFSHNPARVTSTLNLQTIMPESPLTDKDHSNWGSVRDSYKNLYDGHCGDKVWRGMRSLGLIDRKDPIFTRTDAVRRKAIMSSIMCEFLELKGGIATDLWRFISAGWGEISDHGWARLRIGIQSGTSTKRLGASMTVTHHTILCFPNTIECARIDATAIGRVMDAASYHIGYPSIVSAWKAHTILEMSLHNSVIGKRTYDLTPGCLVASDPTVFEVVDRAAFVDATRKLSEFTPKEFKMGFGSALRDCNLEVDEDAQDEEAGIVVAIKRDLRRIDLSMGIVQPGTMRTYMEVGAVEVGRVRKRPLASDFDEGKIYSDSSHSARIRHLSRLGGREFALASVAAEVAKAGMKRDIPSFFYTCRWSAKDMEKIGEECFIKPWDQVKVIESLLDRETSMEKYFDGFHNSIKNCMFQPSNKRGKLVRLGVLGLWASGRFASSDAYRVVHSNSSQMSTTCFNYAAKRQGLLEISAMGRGDAHDQTLCHCKRRIYKVAAGITTRDHRNEELLTALTDALWDTLDEIIGKPLKRSYCTDRSRSSRSRIKDVYDMIEDTALTYCGNEIASGISSSYQTMLSTHSDLTADRITSKEIDPGMIKPSAPVTALPAVSGFAMFSLANIGSTAGGGFGSVFDLNASGLKRAMSYYIEQGDFSTAREIKATSKFSGVPDDYKVTVEMADDLVSSIDNEAEDTNMDER